MILFLRSLLCSEHQLRIPRLILNNEKNFFSSINWESAVSRAFRNLIEYSGCWRLTVCCLHLKLLEMLCPARRKRQADCWVCTAAAFKCHTGRWASVSKTCLAEHKEDKNAIEASNRGKAPAMLWVWQKRPLTALSFNRRTGCLMSLIYKATPVTCLVFGLPQHIVKVPGLLSVMGDRWVSPFSPELDLGIPKNRFTPLNASCDPQPLETSQSMWEE